MEVEQEVGKNQNIVTNSGWAAGAGLQIVSFFVLHLHCVILLPSQERNTFINKILLNNVFRGKFGKENE
jgi:hypothetical protein